MEYLAKERSSTERSAEDLANHNRLSVNVGSFLEKKFEVSGIEDKHSPGKSAGEGQLGVVLENLRLDTATQIWPEIPMTSEKWQKAASFGNISCQVS